MLEIILLVYLTRKIGRNAHEKGRSKAGYMAMLVGLWIGGEFAGLIVGALISHATNPRQTGFDGLAYVFALLGAGAGAIASFVIVGSLSRLKDRHGFAMPMGPRGFPVSPQGPYQPPEP